MSAFSFVISDITPPDEETRISGDSVFGAKMIVPSGAHAAPRGSAVVSAIDCGGPPTASTLRSLPPAKKPIDLLSGDQNGNLPPSVPESCRAPTAVSERTQRVVSPSVPRATKTNDFQSGERANPSLNKLFSGGSIAKRIVSARGCSRRKYKVANATAAIRQSAATPHAA